jgi:hypothetical protein
MMPGFYVSPQRLTSVAAVKLASIDQRVNSILSNPKRGFLASWIAWSNLKGVRRVLYRLPNLLASTDTVFLAAELRDFELELDDPNRAFVGYKTMEATLPT